MVPGSGEPSGLSTTMDTTASMSHHQSAGPGPVSEDRLNIRAMPNPRGYNISGSFGDLLEQQNSADNLRKSMHKMLKTRQRVSDNQSGSDAESVRSESSQGNPQFVVPVLPVSHSASQLPPPLPPRNSQMTQSNPSLSSLTVTTTRLTEPAVVQANRPGSPRGIASGQESTSNRLSIVQPATPKPFSARQGKDANTSQYQSYT